MSIESPRIRSLLRQADSVAAAGKRAAAEQLYRQIIEEAPDTALAWLGLAQVVRDREERESAANRARELNPDYADADLEVVDTAVSGEDDHRRPLQASRLSNDGQVNRDTDTRALAAADDVLGSNRTGGEYASDPTSSRSRAAEAASKTLFCANHPSRQTNLRCNRCGKPICSSCANPTPVGYRCPECIREQEEVYFTATPIDYILAVLVALPLGLLAGWIAARLGFWSFFLAAFAGTLIGRIAFRAARRKRGRLLPQLVAACVILGGVLPALSSLLFGVDILRLVFAGVYVVLASAATYYQMR